MKSVNNKSLVVALSSGTNSDSVIVGVVSVVVIVSVVVVGDLVSTAKFVVDLFSLVESETFLVVDFFIPIDKNMRGRGDISKFS